MADAGLRQLSMPYWFGSWIASGRWLVHSVGTIQELSALGIRFVSVTQGLDSDKANPTSALLLHTLAAVTQFERELIRERVSAGMKTAKAKGAPGEFHQERRP